MSDTERMATALERIVTLLEGMAKPSLSVVPPTPAAEAFATQAPPPGPTASLVCPVHNVEWRRTKGDGTPAKRAYCSKKNDDGSYCDQTGPWLG